MRAQQSGSHGEKRKEWSERSPRCQAGTEQSGISSDEDTCAHMTTSMQKQAANAVGSFLSSTL
ncbi:hypothetical protein [uncultured Oscillibacter sp.]|uniref:hypothetical protein n=1 Tax=uncultured Oscillibacter sp. TaxID=876091 RepID=UPI0025ECAD49|nr:hypothetical protein [uncultured Oscillibacter sp.]